MNCIDMTFSAKSVCDYLQLLLLVSNKHLISLNCSNAPHVSSQSQDAATDAEAHKNARVSGVYTLMTVMMFITTLATGGS